MLLVPMLKQSEIIFQRLPLLLIDSTTGGVWNGCGLTQILIAVVKTLELWPLVDNDVHTHGIAGHFIL